MNDVTSSNQEYLHTKSIDVVHVIDREQSNTKNQKCKGNGEHFAFLLRIRILHVVRK